jgi:hypothetical protein
MRYGSNVLGFQLLKDNYLPNYYLDIYEGYFNILLIYFMGELMFFFSNYLNILSLF